MLTPKILHLSAAGIAIVLGGLGSGVGQGIAGLGTLEAMGRQPMVSNHIIRTMILGLALIESGVILALVITLMLLFGKADGLTMAAGLSELGMGLAIGLSALAVSVASSLAVKQACVSIARQPFFAQKIITLMIISQSIIGAPVIFSFIIAMLIRTQIKPDISIIHGIKYLAAGFTIGFGSIGPSVRQAILSKASCMAAGLNKKSFGKLLTFSLLSQAVIQTTLVFALVVSITIIFKPIKAITDPIIGLVSFFPPGIAISLGSLGTAIALGYAASKSCKPIALDSENYPLYLRTSLLAQAFIESAAIYALIIALVLMTRKL